RRRVRRRAAQARRLRVPQPGRPRAGAEPREGARPQAVSPVSDPLRVAIIGTGNISQAHYDGYRAAGANVVALCDVNPVQLAARASAWGVDRTFSEYREMFAAGGIDAVSIAAPTAVHHPATLAAAEAGVHVLVEKPIALDLALADEMIAACRAAGVMLVVNHQLRSSGPARKAKELVESGAIGRVTHLRLRPAH